MSDKKLSPVQIESLLKTLEARFAKNMKRHKVVNLDKVLEKLKSSPEKLGSLYQMEETGGEPDVVVFGEDIVFCDCSAESPAGRRSLCYDMDGWKSRKEHRPAGNAIDTAAEMGIDLLTEEEYRTLQELGEFDTKTSSWLKTPIEMRKLGGSLYGEYHYGRVFFGHNGAQSYYAVRGFRGILRV